VRKILKKIKEKVIKKKKKKTGAYRTPYNIETEMQFKRFISTGWRCIVVLSTFFFKKRIPRVNRYF